MDKPQKLNRSLALTLGRAEGDQKTYSASLSSEEPYERWFGIEILDHGPDACDLSRAVDGIPLLWGHNGGKPDTVIGRVNNLRIESRRLVGELTFFSTEEGQTVRIMVDEGHREMSVSYTIDLMKAESVEDDVTTYRVLKWTLLEASIVAVPADPTVGVGRDNTDDGPRVMPPLVAAAANPEAEAPPAQEQRAAADARPIELGPEHLRAVADQVAALMAQQTPPAENPQAPAVPATRGVIMTEAATQADPKSAIPDIIALGERFAAQGGDKVAQEYLRSGRSDINEFGLLLLERVGKKATSTAPDELGMSRAEKSRFSIVRLVRYLANPQDAQLRNAAAFELEASEAALRAGRRDLKTGAQATIPTDILGSFGQRDLIVSTSTMGGYTVGTDTLGGSFVDVLRNRSFVLQAGATFLGGLQGAVAIPTKTSGATHYWVTENNAPTEGAIAFGQIAMAPKTLAGFVDFSRKLMLQSSVDVEMMVRNDLAAGQAAEIDRVAVNGAGTGSEPSGILASTSVGTTTMGTHGGAPTWAAMVELESLVAASNADTGSLAYAVNSRTRGKLKTVTKSTSAVTGFVWDGGDRPLNDYRAFVSNNLPGTLTKGTSTGLCSAAIFGNWADLIVGAWGGLDIMVDPYTGSSAGTVRVVAMQDVDVAIRRAASFAYVKDLLSN